MINFVALPLLATLGVVLVGGPRLGRLRPHAAARTSALLLAAVIVAAVPTLWLIGLSGLAHVGIRNPVVDWSRHLLPDHEPFGAIVGIGALAAAIIGSVRAARVVARHHRLRCTDTCPIEFVDTDEVYAYTMPGPAKTIAISHGLRSVVDDAEFDVVVAHERAHARHRHDRYKLLGLLATAFVPPLRSVAARLDYFLERWADEAALRETGAERRLAARTIAKVALAGNSPTPALGIADHGVVARAQALLRPVEHPGRKAHIQTSLIVATTLAFTLYQLHHSALFAAELTG